jgi:polysaccharide chain length determinant protein (PEP-CTERM system associated)
MTPDTLSLTPEEPVLLRALHILRRRVVWAVVVFTTVLAAGTAFAVYLPDLFRASAVVLVERRLQDAFARPDAADEVESRLHVIKQEVLSRARLTDLINRFDLYPDLRAGGDMDMALEQVRRDIQIELTGPEQVNGRAKTVAFNLIFTGSSRTGVAEVANAIASLYVAQNQQMRSEEATRAMRFLEGQIQEARAQLDQNQRQVQTYTNRHAGELPQQIEVNLATLERLNTQLRLNADRQMRALDQRDKLFDAASGAPVIRVPEGSSPEAIRLARLRGELAQLDGFPDKHPDVRRIKDEIAALEKVAGGRPTGSQAAGPSRTPVIAGPASGGARTIASIDAEVASLKSAEAALRQTIAAMERRLERAPYRQNEFASLSRDHQATREQYESLLKEYEAAQLVESMQTSNQGDQFRIIEAAVPPSGPSGPDRLRLLIAGLFAAVMAAGLVVLLLEQVDTSFHSVGDLRRFTGVPVLGAIPRIGPSPGTRWLQGALLVGSVLVCFALAGMLSAYVAHDNASLVRVLVRGG